MEDQPMLGDDMSASSVLPIPTENHEVIRLLQLRVAGESFGNSWIHEEDAYSAAPEKLVHGREHAPGTDQGNGKDATWYFCSPAKYHGSAQAGSTRRRRRKVQGAGEGFRWHPETSQKPVQDANGRPVGYMRTLSYGIKNKSLPAATARSFTRLGWCMMEFSLKQQDGADQLVLCKLKRSPRADQETSTAASSASQGAPPPIERKPFSNHGPVPVYSKLDNDPICQSEAAILKKDDAAAAEGEARHGEKAATVFTGVMKFGGSSVASAERMRKVADLVLSFPGWPVVVLSAMGKTTNNLLLAGEKAVSCGIQKASEIPEFRFIKELHLRTIHELGLESSIVSGLFEDLDQRLRGVALMKELTPRTSDYLVSFGECMSTRIFSAYLTKRRGRKARQYDAFGVGFITTDDFTNADILEATYPAVAKKLLGDLIDDPAIPIVTGFLGKGWKSGAVTTLGRGGGDLTATTIGKALKLIEIQVWKDVDGVLTCDPSICANAIPVPYLTFDETDELAYSGARVLHPRSMQLAKEGGITVRVKNSCNPLAPGTMIAKTRDMSKSKLTSIVLKSNIAMLDIQSKRMPCQCDFQAQVSSILKDLRISVDCMVTRGGNISLTLDPSRLWSRELIQKLEEIAVVYLQQHRSVISLIGNVEMSLILAKAFNALMRIGVEVQMILPGTSKGVRMLIDHKQVMNVSFVVHDSEAKKSVQALHSAFLKDGFFSQVEGKDLGKNGSPTPVNSSAAASSSSKRKVAEDHPKARPAVRRQTDEEDNIPHADEVKRAASSDVLDSSAASKKYTPGGEPAVPSCAERAETEKDPAPCSAPRQTDEEEDIQRDDPTPMPDDLDVLASSKEMGSRVQGGEPAMPRSAPGAVPEEDAGTCPWTEHELMALYDDMSYSVAAECSTGMPCLASAAPRAEDPPSVRQERTDTDGGLLEEIKGWLISDDNPKPVGADDGGALAGLYFSPSILEVQDEQQGLPSPDLPLIHEDGTIHNAPALVLQVRQIPRHNIAVVQWLVQWANLSPEEATWEDANFIKQTFPSFFKDTVQAWATQANVP